MKQAFAMVYTIFFIMFVAFVLVFVVKISSYTPRIMQDLILYTQGKILVLNSKEMSKYFLYQAYLEGKECIEQINFKYNNATVQIDYAYPLGRCENGQLLLDYEVTKAIVAVNVSVLLNENKSVNEEVFLQRSFFIYPKLD
ncbi:MULTISPECIES: hypothetical protein [unclassified Campylobacter]|uniref:hypothetical protein n=1 Tax=unclassified Campylobacter TaxID=2593542 RepID=UPI000EAAA3EE|nr:MULTISPECIES: hypothetical protein [unclassified Campylobacter]QOR00618.1 hypothetical protein A0083_05025 [Campylobacter sp. 2014D-0216]RKO65444.1 hypothetical protein CKA54_01100 [Campylobacter sp. P255]